MVTLYGANGQPLALDHAWQGAGTGRRSREWFPTTSHTNSLLAGDVSLLRSRNRAATRNNPWAISATENYVANHIGTGLRPSPQTDNDELRKQLMDAWEIMVEDCDADGTQDFYGMQAMLARAMREGGDSFLRFRYRRPDDGLLIPLQFQLLEAEMLDPAYDTQLATGNRVRSGIEFDPIGRRTAYHFWKNHPGDYTLGWNYSAERTPVPADQVIHCFHPLRPGQIRGVPGLSGVLTQLKEIVELVDANLLRHKIANLYATFEEVPIVENSILDPQKVSYDSTDVAPLQPGTHQMVPFGHKMVFSAPPQEGLEFSEFMRVHLRSIAVGSGCTYEQLTGDLTGVNFSSIRAGLIDLWRRIESVVEHVFIFQLCRPVWTVFVKTAVLAGLVKLPSKMTPVELRKVMRAQWTQTPGREYVDPLKEVQALIHQVRAGFTTREEIVKKYGFDVIELDRRIAAERKREDEMELVFSSRAEVSISSGVQDPAEDSTADEAPTQVQKSKPTRKGASK